MAFAEDLSLFFDATNGFAVDVSATTRLGAAVQFKAIFDAPHVDVLGTGLMESSGPVLIAVTADVQDLAHRDRLTVNAKVYAIESIQPDGTGVTLFKLEAV